MLRLFLYSKIHAKYRKPIDMVGNIMYDDVVDLSKHEARRWRRMLNRNYQRELCGNRMRRSRTKQYGRVLRFACRSAEAYRR